MNHFSRVFAVLKAAPLGCVDDSSSLFSCSSADCWPTREYRNFSKIGESFGKEVRLGALTLSPEVLWYGEGWFSKSASGSDFILEAR